MSGDVQRLNVSTKGGSVAAMREALDEARAAVDAGGVCGMLIIVVAADGTAHVVREWDSSEPLAWLALRGAEHVAAASDVAAYRDDD